MQSGVDLYEQLRRQRKRREKESERFLDNVKLLLFEEVFKDIDTEREVRKNKEPFEYPDLDSIDVNRVFSEKDIRSVCIKYHLRFLHSSLFINSFPASVLRKIRWFNTLVNVPVNYFIMAPAKAFSLKNKDSDPVLFAKVGDDKYYYLDKWGKDLHLLRKIVMFPLRSLFHLVLVLLGTSVVMASAVPENLLVNSSDAAALPYRFILFITLFFCFCAILSFSLLTFHKNFSNKEWNSKYLS